MENMKVPNHIAIILDGNGRWAKAKGMPRGYGHIKGCANLETICDDIKDLGVKYLTVYAFSTENWKRSREEVEGLMKLFRSYLKKCMKSAEKNRMRVKIIGDPTAFAPDIQEKIKQLEEFSKDYVELYFQIALNRELEQDETRLENAMKVFKVMLSAEAQDIVCNGQDTLSYSQDVPLKFTDALKDARPVVEENHMYIRIASNDFFSVSKDVVSKMIAGEYNAEQAYEAFDSQLREPANSDTDIILSSDESYSNYFHNDGGNKAYSVMANSLRNMYGSDVLIATADSFTGNVLKADYTEKMAGNMIMPNHLKAYSCKISGAELKELVNAFVEGYDGGLIPFNSGSLPTVSGISMEINKNKDAYTLSKLTKDGKEIKDDESFTVTCLATEKHMTALLGNEQYELKAGDKSVKDAWTEYLKQGGDALAAPEQYISLR